MRSNWVPAAIVCFAIAGIASGCRSSGGGFSNPLAGMFGGNKSATAESGSTVVPGSEYAQQSGAPDVQLPSAQATPYGHGPSMGPAAAGNQYAGQYGAYPDAGGAAYNAMNGGAGAAGAGAYGEMSYADAAQQYQGGGYPLASQAGAGAIQANPYAAGSMAPQQGAYGQSAAPYGAYGATASTAPPYGATSPAAGAAAPYGASPYGAPGVSPEVMVSEAEASQAPMMGSSRYGDTTTGATGDSRYSVASRYDTPGSASPGVTANPYATNTPGYPAPSSSPAGAYPSTPADAVVPSATSRYPESAASAAPAYPTTSAAPVTASSYPSAPPAGTVYPSSPETYGAPAASAPASSYRPGGTTDYAPVSPSTGSGIAPGGYGAMRTGVTPASYDQSPSTIVRYGEKPCADGSCQDCQSCPPQMAAPVGMGVGGESLSVVTPPEVAMPAVGSQL